VASLAGRSSYLPTLASPCSVSAILWQQIILYQIESNLVSTCDQSHRSEYLADDSALSPASVLREDGDRTDPA